VIVFLKRVFCWEDLPVELLLRGAYEQLLVMLMNRTVSLWRTEWLKLRRTPAILMGGYWKGKGGWSGAGGRTLRVDRRESAKEGCVLGVAFDSGPQKPTDSLGNIVRIRRGYRRSGFSFCRSDSRKTRQ
jgi:hypothetical protein